MSTTKRKPGFYFVRYNNYWIVAEYDAMGKWEVCHNSAYYDDSEWDEINEVRINTPDETTGVNIILAERTRQITEEGFSLEHDRGYLKEELAKAACFYAAPVSARSLFRNAFLSIWPFSLRWCKETPNDRVRELAKAGALIAAEIDRILSIEASAYKPKA